MGEGWSRQSLELDELTAQGDKDDSTVIGILTLLPTIDVKNVDPKNKKPLKNAFF